MSNKQDPGSALAIYAFPATPLQERIWMLEKKEGLNPAWNVAVRFQLQGLLSISRFQAALNQVVAQTEILRTRFEILDNSLKQLTTDVLPNCLRIVDCSDSEDFDSAISKLSLQEAETPLEMSSFPLFRVVLARRNEQSHILLITAHHAIVDGYSVGLLSDAILAAYGAPDVKNNIPLQFADYAIWLQEYRESADYQEHGLYWQDAIKDWPQISEQHKAVKGRAHIESVLLERSLTDKVQQLAKNLEVTFPQMTLAVMSCILNDPGRVIGIPVACRSQIQLEGLIGPLVNYIPMQVSYSLGDSFEEVLAKFSDASNTALLHSEYRYEDILQLSGIPEGSLFDTVFICQRDFVQSRLVDGIELTPIPSVSPGALQKLTVFLVERSDGWRLSCEFTGEQAQQHGQEFLQKYTTMLHRVCGDSKAPVELLINASTPSEENIESTLQSIPQTQGQMIFPASATQERYWSLDRIDPGNNKLNLHIRYSTEQRLDYSVFCQALQMLEERHPTLRTHFLEEQENVFQCIDNSSDAVIKYVDRSDEVLNDETVSALFDIEKEIHFDLEKAPLWSALLINSHNCSCFCLTFAHSICDGWSCGIFARELLATYEAIATMRTPNYSAPVKSFAEMVSEGAIAGPKQNFADRLNYWDAVLADPMLNIELPADHSERSTAVVTRTIDPMLALTVAQTAQEYGVTIASIYTAAYRALLFRYTGQSNLLIASPMANRFPGAEGVIGPFADSLFLRSEIGETFESAIHAVQNTLLSAMENNIPLQLLMEKLHHKNITHSASTSIGFMYQEAFVRDLAGDHLTLRSMHNPVIDYSFEWYMAIIDRAGEITMEFTSNPSKMSDQLAATILEDFELSLSGYVLSPRKRISKIEGCTEKVLQICRVAQMESKATIPLSSPANDETLTVPAEAIATMVGIWKGIFKYPQLAQTDNFFSLGGHSLLLARLQVAIEKEFGCRIFASDIFAAPTCETLAKRVFKKQNRYSDSSLEQIIPLHSDGQATPLFMISQSMIMRELAKRLGNAQPCFTIQFSQEDVKRIGSNASMQEVAALYIEYLRKARPNGPYRLGGWCVSGWVAYEMARQLEAAGEDVELLLILDAWIPNFWNDLRGGAKIVGRSCYYAHRVYFGLSQLFTATKSAHSDSGMAQTLWRIIQTATKKLANLITSNAYAIAFADEPFEKMMDHAARTYRPAPYRNNRTIVFRSEEQPRGGSLPADMGWHQLLPTEVEIVPLPGDHTSMFSDDGAMIMANHIIDLGEGHLTKRTHSLRSSIVASADLIRVPSYLS